MARASPAGRPSQKTIPAPGRIPVTLTVNGAETHLEIRPWTTLLDALRDQLGLTGTKKGCDHGQCGACTVLVDGRRVNSCLTPGGDEARLRGDHDRGSRQGRCAASDAAGVHRS